MLCVDMDGHGCAHVMQWVGMNGHRSLLMGIVWVWVQFKGKCWDLLLMEVRDTLRQCTHSLLEKTVTESTQNQQRIVGSGCCFSRVGPVTDQQRIVDWVLLIWSHLKKNYCSNFAGKKLFFTTRIFGTKKLIFDMPGLLWHPNPTHLCLQG